MPGLDMHKAQLYCPDEGACSEVREPAQGNDPEVPPIALHHGDLMLPCIFKSPHPQMSKTIITSIVDVSSKVPC